MKKEQRDINRKLKVLQYAAVIGHISKACRYYGISRSVFYLWKKAYEQHCEAGLINSKPCPVNIPSRTPLRIKSKILHLRKKYHLGPQRIAWFLERYHGITVSASGVYCVLKRNGMNRLPRNARKRTVLTHRYEKQAPGHHIQVDVKFLRLRPENGRLVRRFQFTVIDDATRIRALKIYSKHTQENAIKFIDYVISKFPFRINTVFTDNGHEFQAKFHWHLADLGIRHTYIKPRTPRLNGKVERSHRTDDIEFYQLFSYTGDVDLNLKLKEWENYSNYNCPQGAHPGKTMF